ncbi:hypothetical protein Tco_0905037 [Tanacetum coccineum]
MDASGHRFDKRARQIGAKSRWSSMLENRYAVRRNSMLTISSRFVEEPVEIGTEIKQIEAEAEYHWLRFAGNSGRGPEVTWNCEDSSKQKYHQFFTNRACQSTTGLKL